MQILIMESGSFLALGGAAQDTCDMYRHFSRMRGFRVDAFGNFGKISDVPSIPYDKMLSTHYDAVILNSIRDVPAIDTYARANRGKAKFVYVDRGNLLPNFDKARAKRLLPKMIARRYLMHRMKAWLTDYVAINADQALSAKRFFSGTGARISFIPVTPSPIYKRLALKRTYGGALFVGRLDERQKKVSFLLKGVARAVQKYGLGNKEVLRIVGTGPHEAAYKKLARDLGILGNVRFMGFVASGEIVKVYNNAGFFVSASEWEGLSRTFLEAMACGLPLMINTNINTALSYNPTRRLVREGYNGLVYRYGDYNDFVDKFGSMLSGRGAAALSRNALSVAKQFSEAKAMREYEKLLKG
jgi:glycosyltransferase involved in cell wall biosynthesis